jgi:chromosome segregation ATPase
MITVTEVMEVTEIEKSDEGDAAAMRGKMRMLEQMAEALEDEAGGLYRRAAVYEEEEFLLAREIEARQTEINRLSLKLEGLRADRDALLGKIDSLTGEAATLREEVYRSEEARALAAIENAQTAEIAAAIRADVGDFGAISEDGALPATFFRRVQMADV